MSDWIPFLTLPNIRMSAPVENDCIALVPWNDERLAEVAKEQKNFATYLKKFKDQFGQAITPGMIILHKNANAQFRSAAALAAFRDLIALSVIPIGWAWAMTSNRNWFPRYADTFAIYPWALDKNYEHLIMRNMANLNIHSVDELNAQSYPDINPIDLDSHHFDEPLLTALLARWTEAFEAVQPSAYNRALFRSLNMANAASKLPASVEMTDYDLGRSLALWVSAFEILVHPHFNYAGHKQVYEVLQKPSWRVSANQGDNHDAYWQGNTALRTSLPCWLYGELYKTRNIFMHGEPLAAKQLLLPSGKPIFHYPQLLYRMVLTHMLDLTFKEIEPPKDDVKGQVGFHFEHGRFYRFQERIETAIATAI